MGFGILLGVYIVAPRLGVAMLILASLVAFHAMLRNGFAARHIFSILVGFLVFLGWALISALTISHHDGEFASMAKVGGLFLAGSVAILFWISGDRAVQYLRVDKNFIYLGVALGGLVLLIAFVWALVTGQSLWGSYYFDPLTTLNNSSVILSLFVWPLICVFFRNPSIIGGLVIAGAVVMIALLPSTAALGALVVGGVVVLVRRIAGKLGGAAIVLMTVFMVIMAPYSIKALNVNGPSAREWVNDTSSALPYSARHRLAMWAFAAEKIDVKPWLGWGFGASRFIPQEDHRLAPNMEIMPLHPHNLVLQTRLELGIPGVLILAGLVFAIFYRLLSFNDDGWKSGLAMAPAASWFFVANVSYGMWQSWWIATAFLLAIVMRLALFEEADCV